MATVSFGKHLRLYNTRLGWVVSGDVPLNNQISKSSLALTTTSLQEQVERFWQLEEFKQNSYYTADELKCEEIFARDSFRDETGRFVVSIPLKDCVKLGNSKETAIKRFLSLERKLQKQPEVKKMYVQFIEEYHKLEHMTKISVSSPKEVEYFLPHHVLRECSSTTKLRVVFDGSCKTDSGQSLNDIQFTGPTIQNDLFSILINFRKHTYIATADLKQMYRQILVNKNQRHLQQILWRSDPREELSIYQLNTVTYGTKSAPYLAIKCLHELADQNSVKFSNEAACIKNDFYVDDLLTGADNINILRTRCINIKTILASAGCTIHKWTSNTRHLLFNTDQLELFSQNITINQDDATKTLGIMYQPSTDTFHYTFNNKLQIPNLTKRVILSATAQNFDPLGILSPLTIIAKCIIQKLWQLNFD